MNKRLFFIMICFLFLGRISSAQMKAPQFGKFIQQGPRASEDAGVLSAAEKMQKRLMDENRPSEMILENAIHEIPNPFMPRLPQDAVAEIEKIPEPIRISQNPISRIDTAPPDVQEPTPNFKISGMVWNTHKPQAILDNTILNVGDDIHGWRIINISKDGVLIESENQTRYLIVY